MDSIAQQQGVTSNNNVENPYTNVQPKKPKKNKKADRKRESRIVTNAKFDNKSQKNANADGKKRKIQKDRLKKKTENNANNFTAILKREIPKKDIITEKEVSSLENANANAKNDEQHGAIERNNFPSTSLNASDEKESLTPSEMPHLKKLTEEYLEILTSHFIVPLTKQSPRFERAIFYCRACDNHINSLHHTVRHIRETGHIKLVRKKSSVELLKIIPEPTQFHYKILHDNLCDLALNNCRPLSDYEKFDAIAAILTTIVRSRILNDNEFTVIN
uniref:RNA uridylyltransferase n=1 Tax=Romanomermis culicivorax TaxID=13658 RepID=A0A915L3X0_ROMCU